MENHQRIVQLALCFDAIVFGGYVRDVLICKQDSFNDIDILWYNTIHNSLEAFIAVLLAEPWVKTHEISNKTDRMYGDFKTVIHIVLNGNLRIDLVKYHGTRTSWMTERDCDFSCNLFYRSRQNNLGLRYVPESFVYSPDPFTHIYNLTVDKKFTSIGNEKRDRYWKRISERVMRLVKKGWILQGELIKDTEKTTLGNAYPLVIRTIKQINNIMNERALGVIEPGINNTCKERIRKQLFDSDSDSESVESSESLVENPN
jgi:hypothetical protein